MSVVCSRPPERSGQRRGRQGKYIPWRETTEEEDIKAILLAEVRQAAGRASIRMNIDSVSLDKVSQR